MGEGHAMIDLGVAPPTACDDWQMDHTIQGAWHEATGYLPSSPRPAAKQPGLKPAHRRAPMALMPELG